MRADRWLWAARFYKSRSLAAEACEGGKVEVNGHTAKPHKLVRVDDTLEFPHPHGLKKLKVLAVSDKRGPATEARLLYEDHSPPHDADFDFFAQPSFPVTGQRASDQARAPRDRMVTQTINECGPRT